MPLPALREELSLHPGPKMADGAPTWTLRDPVRSRFFQIGWPAFEMLARWSFGSPEAIVERVNAETTLHIEESDVIALAEFLQTHQLINVMATQDIGRFTRLAEAEKTSWFTWLLHHYLFFRIPLVRPDQFLERTSRWVRWVYTREFMAATLAALVVGLFLACRQWDVFKTTLVDTLTIEGMISYGIAYGAVKIIHELSHAYTAKRMGCRVPSMGVAFLVLWPVLYTDVNETWILPHRKQRLAVGAAGIIAELTIAAWALLAWSFLPAGSMRSAAFAVATVTLVASLAINLSPFMRFDGYYILMDLINMPNLHPRSFALARWWMREKLFHQGDAPPEPHYPVDRRWLIAFAFAVWIYRLSLFLGIAALVYHFFIKIVGIGLFAVEIGWFVILPVWQEIKDWKQYAHLLHEPQRKKRLAMAAAAVFLLLVVPWRDHIAAPAILKAGPGDGIYVPSEAKLVSIDVVRGQHVQAGQRLFTFTSPDLNGRMAEAEARQKGAEYALSSISFDNDFRENADVLRQQLSATSAEEVSLRADIERLTVTAPMDGVVLDIEPDLHVGDWLSPSDRLASLEAPHASLVEAYVGEADVKRLDEGDSALFIPDAATHALKRCRIALIDRSPVRSLPEAELASVYGGRVAVRQKDSNFIPEAALYRVQLEVEEADLPDLKQRGLVRISGRSESLLGRSLRSVLAILVREWGV